MKFGTLIFFAALSAQAATYYVRTDGDDLNSGTSNTAEGAWLTVQKAASTMVAGDTAIVADGSYAESVTSGAAGTLEAPITFQGQSTNAVLRGFAATHQYQVVDGFTFTGDSIALDASFYCASGAHNCVVRNCRFNSSLPSVFQVATALSQSDLVTNLHVLNNQFLEPYYHGVMLRCGNGHLVQSNLFTSKNGTDAIQVFADNVIIRGNLFTNWDNSELRSPDQLKVGVGYYFVETGGGADFSNVGAGPPPYSVGEEGSPFQATGAVPTAWGTAVLMTGNHPDIIQSHNTGYDNHSAHNLLFENNVVIDCEGEVQLSNISDDANLNNITGWTYRNNLFVRIDRTMNLAAPGFKLFNNTFYKCAVNSGSVLTGGVFSSGTTSNLTFYNNLMVECGDPTSTSQGWYNMDSTVNQLMDYNLVVGTGAGTTKQTAMWTAHEREAHGLNGVNPLFVNAAGNDFRLSTNSPAIGAGYALNEIFTADIRGLTRGAAWDIGAYEFQEGEEVEPEPEEPPAAVSGSATAARANVETLILR